MPFQLRTTTLAAFAVDKGIRVYTTSGDGDIREGCLDVDQQTLTQAAAMVSALRSMQPFLVANMIEPQKQILQQADHWFPGEMKRACDSNSTLCAFGWASWTQTVFYQTTDGSLREARHDYRWWDTSFNQPNCMPGTDIAEVHSSNADRVMLFFQDKDGYLCYRRARNWQWENSVRLCKAATCTAIGATTWNDTQDIRLYYQQESENTIREYCGSFDGGWSTGEFVGSAAKPLGTIAAISWPGHISVFHQDASNTIIEWCWDNRPWTRGDFTVQALPNTDIIAFQRNVQTGHITNVLWAGPDQILHQRVWASNVGWLDATPIGYLTTAGAFAGSWSGNHFTDNDSNIDHKKIRRIRFRSGSIVDGFAIDFTDGSSTPWRGGYGGVVQEFTLNEGEDITQVLVASNGNNIQRVKLITSQGRQSINYGIDGGGYDVWEYEGKALAGFAGATGQYVNGLYPMWSERQSAIGPAILQGLISEATRMQNDAAASRSHCDDLNRKAADLDQQIESGLKPPAGEALKAVNVLVGSIEELYNAGGNVQAMVPLVAKCKGQSKVVAERFKTLHEKAQSLMNVGAGLTTDITHESATADSRIKRIGDMQKIASAMRVGAEARQQMEVDRVKVAQDSIETARRTKAEAEKKRESAQSARIVRDIFTFGLGEIGDWGGLNDAIDYANKLINSAQNNLVACQNALAQAQAGINQISEELRRFDDLRGMVSNLSQVLQGQVTFAVQLRNRSMELTNAALGLSTFLGGLSASSETLSVHGTAAQFAQNVLTMGRLVGAGTAGGGLLIQEPNKVQSMLERIAASDVAAADVGDLL